MSLRSYRVAILSGFVVFLFLLAPGCATTPKSEAVTAPVSETNAPKPAESSLSLKTDGFWPTPESSVPLLFIIPKTGNPESLVSWRLFVFQEGTEHAIRSFQGTGSSAPGDISWDGRDDKGNPSKAGMYVARIILEYGAKFASVSVDSKPFILSRDPPSGTLELSSDRLVPVASGIKDTLLITATATPALVPIAGWQIDVLTPSNDVFHRFAGALPISDIAWDGFDGAGNPLLPGTEYSVVLSLRDVYGNVSAFRDSVSVDPLPELDEVAGIQVSGEGISPDGDGLFESLDFALSVPRTDIVSAWRVDMVNAAGKTSRSFSATKMPQVPKTISWDGRDETGTAVSDGVYRAVLTVDFGRIYARKTVRCEDFLVDKTPPVATLSVPLPLFSPDGDGHDDTLRIVGAQDGGFAQVVAWTLDVVDSEGVTLAEMAGTGDGFEMDWDGKIRDKSGLLYAEDFGLVYRCTDSLGNRSETKASFGTDFLVTKEEGGYRVLVPGIAFKPFTPDWRNVPEELVARNVSTLKRLAISLNRFPDYKIKVAGHAVLVNWAVPERAKKEQEDILLPLSFARANSIVLALSDLGVDPGRFTVEGFGGSRPLVPHSDEENRWKNRRVEFFLVRE